MATANRYGENSEGPLQPLLSVSAVAELLGVSPSLVYQIVEAGKIPFHRVGIGRGSIRFQREDVKAYIEACRFEKTQQDRKPLQMRLKHIKIGKAPSG
ncbi:MAG: helix-turn-helix domain-containing protein [Planctomycetaceae bacterium]